MGDDVSILCYIMWLLSHVIIVSYTDIDGHDNAMLMRRKWDGMVISIVIFMNEIAKQSN